MTTVSVRGFTVIELMLFLGITGALFAALMFGVNSNITQQRYRDSVVSLNTLLQGQYSEVSNTRNERDNNWKCNEDGTIAQSPVEGEPRGASACVILGRAIEIQDNGTKISTSSVVGREPVGQATTSDIATLLAYHPRISSFDTQDSTVDWGSALSTTTHQPSMASILILRSPASGLIRVFTSPSPFPADISSLISPAGASGIIKACFEGDRGSLPKQSISIDPRISGPNGVMVNEVDSACV